MTLVSVMGEAAVLGHFLHAAGVDDADVRGDDDVRRPRFRARNVEHQSQARPDNSDNNVITVWSKVCFASGVLEILHLCPGSRLDTRLRGGQALTSRR